MYCHVGLLWGGGLDLCLSCFISCWKIQGTSSYSVCCSIKMSRTIAKVSFCYTNWTYHRMIDGTLWSAKILNKKHGKYLYMESDILVCLQVLTRIVYVTQLGLHWTMKTIPRQKQQCHMGYSSTCSHKWGDSCMMQQFDVPGKWVCPLGQNFVQHEQICNLFNV